MKTFRVLLSIFSLGIFLVLALATSPSEPPYRKFTQLRNTTASNMVVLVRNPGDSAGIVVDSAFVVAHDSLEKADTFYYKFFRMSDSWRAMYMYNPAENSFLSLLPDSFSTSLDHAVSLVRSKIMHTMSREKLDAAKKNSYSSILYQKDETDFVLSIPPGQHLPILVCEKGDSKEAPRPFDYVVTYTLNGKTKKLEGNGNDICSWLGRDLPFNGIYDVTSRFPVTVYNYTSSPVKITEEGNFVYKQDSGYYGVIYNWPDKPVKYYVFLENEQAQRYPGFFDERTMLPLQFKGWVQSQQLQPFDLDTFYFDKKYRIKTNAAKNSVTFWLKPSESFLVTAIPPQEPFISDENFPTLTFIFKPQNEKSDSTLRLHGKEFYRHINAHGDLILQ